MLRHWTYIKIVYSVFVSTYIKPVKKYVRLKIMYKSANREYVFPMKYIGVVAEYEQDLHVPWKADDILLFSNSEKDWNAVGKGSYILGIRVDSFEDFKENPLRICKCIGVSRGFPLIFDGSETLGIGYDSYGILKYIITKDSGYKNLIKI